jgi:Ala-tRNA(Pro) deacylase
MPFSSKLQEFLEVNDVPYRRTVDAEAYTARDVAQVVIISADNGYHMLVLPANRSVDLWELRTTLGLSHARLATQEEIGRLFPDCDPNAVPPLANLYRMPVYVDSSLALDDWIAFHDRSHADVIHVRFKDYRWLINPIVLPLARELELSGGR